ncbi:MAG: diguanylate cyclase [Planctomycetes bacterium]|nr:diguanylate cyclase [Planctomycetota bacterium]
MSDRFYKKILDSLHEGVYFADRDRKITYWNKAAERLTGYASAEMVGTHCHDNLLKHVDEQGNLLCLTCCPLMMTVTDGQSREADIYLHHKDGHRLPVSVRVAPIHDDRGQVVGAVEMFNDCSEKVAALARVAELQKLALLDPLTGLANRRYIQETLGGLLSQLARYGWPFGILMMDIDHFKRVNDTYGHEVGDRVLRMVGHTLARNTRSFDLTGRWGGEEFVSCVLNVNSDALHKVSERYRVLVEQSYLMVGRDAVRATVSVGATLGQASDTVDTLIQRADQLMYESKAAGRNRVTMRT